LFDSIRKSSPVDAKYMNYSSIEDLFGPNATQVTIRQLGKMMSGVPDFDTAHGSGSQARDALRATMCVAVVHARLPGGRGLDQRVGVG
jgi:hypothetical protein